VTITLLSKPCEKPKLKAFYEKVKPSGPFWKPVSGDNGESTDTSGRDNLKVALVGWLASILATLGCLFGLGKLLLCEYVWGACWLVVCVFSGTITLWSVRKLTQHDPNTTF